MNLIDLIDENGKCDKKIAHQYRNSYLTYSELVNKSDAIACYLIEKYGTDKTPIVVYGHKQHEMLICFLACVKSGHAYIPIDSSLPYERVKDIIESSKTKAIFSVGEFNCEINTELNDIEVINLKQIDKLCINYQGVKPDSRYKVKEEETYYIIYTSGSTGKPKGVQITLACLESFVKWGLQLININDDKSYVFMNQAPFSFDLSVMDLYLSLASGSTLFSIDKAMIANLRELFEQLKQSKINVWVSTPSFAEMCLVDNSFNRELLKEVETFLFCGEVLTNSCVNKLHERFSNSKVINLYGPTEATVAVTAVTITEEINETINPLPVGYVKEDCNIFIVDSEGKKVNEGEKGEIIIAGDSVSIGYYNNEEQTEKVFSKILLDNVEKRYYKTGDEGYLLDGMLHYCGRIDFQIKLNGFRIELEDIESNLRKVNLIKNAAVLPVMKDGKIQQLAAVVTLKEPSKEKEFKIGLAIKNDLKKLLPEYMIPRKIVIKDSLPMTVNGKVDRRGLMEEIK